MLQRRAFISLPEGVQRAGPECPIVFGDFIVQRPWWDRSVYARRKPNLKIRAQAISAIRQYFNEEGFLEVETPAIQVSPGIDGHIQPFDVSLEGPFDERKVQRYLHTSPEFSMKKLLAAGEEKIFQICHVFRNKESGRLHTPEFTMLEWYRAGENYEAIIDDVVELVSCAASATEQSYLRHNNFKTEVSKNWIKLTVADAFQKFANIDLLSHVDENGFGLSDKFITTAREIGIPCKADDQWDDVFHRVMMTRIEPEMSSGAPVLLIDFPSPVGALARNKRTNSRVCERVEAYVCGLELANGFSELTDAKEQRRRFERDQAAFTCLYGTAPPIDEDFLDALVEMPESAGMALGIDRLAMLLTGADEIGDVLWSPILIE